MRQVGAADVERDRVEPQRVEEAADRPRGRDAVHGADVALDFALTPQAAGLNAIADGFAHLYGTRDHEKLAAESPVYDALYEWCRRQTAALDRAPRARARAFGLRLGIRVSA